MAINPYIQNVLELPKPHKIGIVAGSVLLIAGFFWFVLIAPAYDELDKAQTAISGPNGLQSQISQQRGIAANLDKYRAEVESLDIELKKALTELPDKREIDVLLAQVSTLGRDSGLEVRVFKPRDEQKKDYYAEVPVEMEMYGSYHQLATFFDEVGHMDRIVNLGEFDMREPEISDEAVYLKSKVVATTFRFLDENERPDTEDEGTDRKRRGRGSKGADNKKKKK